uniref:P-type domain-containing protein n=1 Tax=Chrysemys picta bellii TaxID=8478 RepID=A0A8C3HCF6_CHRPI
VEACLAWLRVTIPILLASFTSLPPIAWGWDNSEVKLRQNCGYPGIPAKECEARGCCFESNPPAVPWCFFPHLVEEGKLCV